MDSGRRHFPFLFGVSLAIHALALAAVLWLRVHFHWHGWGSVEVAPGVCSLRVTTVTAPRSAPAPPPVPAAPLPQSKPQPKPREEKTPEPPSVAQSGALTPSRPNTDNASPVYPEEARRRGVEGTSLLLVRVGRGGEAKEVTLARGSGSPLLDEAALEAVRHWRFRPASLGGVAVESLVEVPIRFRLDRNAGGN